MLEANTPLETSPSLLECVSLTKKMGEFRLADIHFALQPGYILGVIGRNGTGKTTLVRLIAGSYELEEQGDSILAGTSIKENVVGYKKQIAYILHKNPFPQMITPKDCAMVYGYYYKGFDKKKYREYLKEFEVPETVIIKNLSKGQQIRQQLAFALSYKAKLYILDEPAANLDVEFRDIFYQYVRRMTEDGTSSVIYVSHLVDELEQLADYILWLGAEKTENKKRGYQRFFGTMDELREQFQLIEMSKRQFKESAVKNFLEKEDLKKTIKEENIIGVREREHHQEMLVQIDRELLPEEIKQVSRYASLKEIMYYNEKGVEDDETDMGRALGRK